jgi:ABC-type nitrate/sulfonate/bicarbonate transport system permease component
MYAKNRIKQIVFPIIIVAIWQVFSLTGILPATKIPSPADIVYAVMHLAVNGLPTGKTLFLHCLYSVLRVASGFLCAVAVAIPLGIITAWSAYVRDFLSPIIEMIRPIPPLAWIPLAILWFGIGIKSAAFIIFLGCFFPILLSTISGVLSVDTLLVDAARTLGAKERDIFVKVFLPGATPSIYTGLRIGLGIGWMTLVAAEFTGVKSGYGLGYMSMTARDIQRPDLVVAGMAVIGLVGYLLDILLRFFESKSLRWRLSS